MRFEFATAARIVFGPGTVRRGSRGGGGNGTARAAGHARGPRISNAWGLTGEPFPVHGEPTVEMVRQGTNWRAQQSCDMVIALGGGSAIDAGKAIAALLTNGGDPLDYLEVVGRGQPLTRPSAPFIAIPTTAGTGSEVTRNAVLASPEHRVKASLRSPHMLPRAGGSGPRAHAGPAAGAHRHHRAGRAHAAHRAVCLLPRQCHDGSVLRRRHAAGGVRAAAGLARRPAISPPAPDMALASLLGGLALANAGLGAVHGFAAPLGGMFDAPHGALCAALLPHAMRVNIAALRGFAIACPGAAGALYATVARILTGDRSATPEDGAAWVECLCRDLEIRPLARIRSPTVRHARAGGEGGPRQQHESQSHRAHARQLEELLARAI